MANLLDYVKTNGIYTFKEKPFTVADNVCLSMLAYIELEGIVPHPREAGSTYIADAHLAYRQSIHTQSCAREALFAEMAFSRRFGTAQLSNYTNEVNEHQEMQFAAVCVRLDDGTLYVAYRGTTSGLIGWKEDFNMTYAVVPAQKAAANYLRFVAKQEDIPLRVGGHSKGGNLAEYAAMMCADELSERVVAVYSNDGPGIFRDFVVKEKHALIRPKLIRIVPAFCVFGLLFETNSTYAIVCSNAEGVQQHDAMSWLIHGDDFVAAAELAPESVQIRSFLHAWIYEASIDQRRAFVTDFFAVLASEAYAGFFKGDELESQLTAIMRQLLRQSSRKTRVVIGKFVKNYLQTMRPVSTTILSRRSA